MVLGDMNARLRAIEPGKETDANGQMLEEWSSTLDLTHLNKSDKCKGKYTFGRPETRRSAIDHILVNVKMNRAFKGMRIDEEAEELNISDHNLIRTWFKVGRINGTDWKKPKSYQ